MIFYVFFELLHTFSPTVKHTLRHMLRQWISSL